MSAGAVRIGVVVAMPAEARALFGPGAWAEEDGWPLRRVGLPCGEIAVAVLSGVGLERALPAARFLIGLGVDVLVSAGVSGGLHPEMRPGDLVVAGSAVEMRPDGDEPVVIWEGRGPRQREFRDLLAREGLSVRLGPVLAGTEPVAVAGDKQDLHVQTRALAVDMESAAVAHAAREAGLPFLALRAVSDPAGSDVPLELFYAMDDQGRVRPGFLLRAVLRRPALLWHMAVMGLGFRAALKALGRAWKIQARHGFSGILAGGAAPAGESRP